VQYGNAHADGVRTCTHQTDESWTSTIHQTPYWLHVFSMVIASYQVVMASNSLLLSWVSITRFVVVFSPLALRRSQNAYILATATQRFT
jgi:hypothetical protein